MFERIEKILSTYCRQKLSAQGLTLAAVLVPLFMKNGQPHILMGRRTDRVLKHKRQISFPGGVRDPQDQDMRATALREAQEEVGLAPEDVNVLGLLSDTQTKTGFLITPVVGTFPYPYDFKLNRVEMEELLQVPWTIFSHPPDHRREMVEHQGRSFEGDYYGFENHLIWGATARIARQLVELVENSDRTSRERK